MFCMISAPKLRPNPLLKLSSNGVPHWPSSAGPAAHFPLAGQHVTPSAPALQEPLR